jgi:hypothetical protein
MHFPHCYIEDGRVTRFANIIIEITEKIMRWNGHITHKEVLGNA